MSVAINQALTLRQAFTADQPTGIRRDLARTVRSAWTLSSTEDWRFPHTRGRRGWTTRFAHRTFDRLLSAAMTDPVLAYHVAEVFALTRPPGSLATARVLRALTGRRTCGAHLSRP
ncbi:hypothetical protein [Amycolatopsis panacis]|uniref:Uncharacterized protein n=1 Tax=Amycolatopsis panacis TaxID=2340917 RepID=A0A419HTT7_9PSEU|nr:hypothetical protein [Amycolatopsis panacis]RJQ80223.1 hypothetical protein D5S19_25050 [Amycolatopsis panacis]